MASATIPIEIRSKFRSTANTLAAHCHPRFILGITMLSFKVTTVGAAAGFILTKEAMARLKVKKGDTVFSHRGAGRRLSADALQPGV